MQDYKTNIPHRCRRMLIKFSREKGEEGGRQINREGGKVETEGREKSNVSSVRMHIY